MEAYKASAIMRVMVDKLKAHREQQRYIEQLPETQREAAQRLQNFKGRGHPMFGFFANGSYTNVNADDLPPEQSAAMTLNMLSSGGMAPNANFGSNMKHEQYQNSMAGMLNEQQPMPERTGLTPGYSGPDASGQSIAGAASPFSSMFGQSSNFMGMDIMGGDVDWVSFAPIQTTGLYY